MLWIITFFFFFLSSFCNLQVTVDRSLDESSGNRSSRGSRGRGRCRTVQVYVEKSSQVSNVGKAAQEEVKSQEDGLGSTKQPDEGAAFKCSGDNSDLLQPSASPVSRECEGRMSFGLANRMEDVSLCGQVSMSSTSDKKVEGNAWNESNTRLFDICLEKKVFCLKPPLKELNQAKRRATKGCIGIVIRPGMVLLKNYLSINDQVTTLSLSLPFDIMHYLCFFCFTNCL